MLLSNYPDELGPTRQMALSLALASTLHAMFVLCLGELEAMSNGRVRQEVA